MNFLRTSHRAAPALAACVVGLAAAPKLFAQDQTTAFVHGLRIQNAWDAAAERLRQEFRIRPFTPRLDWRQSWSSQAGQVNGAVLPGGGVIAAGYSNGGPVAREFNRVYGRNDRIVTLTGANSGAPASANVLNGTAYYYAGSLAGAIASAVGYYAYWEAQGVEWAIGYIGLLGLAYTFQFGAYIPHLLAMNGFAAGQVTGGVLPVLRDLSPGSAAVAALNSSANLGREAQSMHARVGIASIFPTAINQQFYFLAPAYVGRLVTARRIAWGASVAAYLYYQYWISPYREYYYQLHSGAWLWARSALWIMDMDAWWCLITGTLQAYQRYGIYGYAIACSASDGLIPLEYQRYPNGTRQYTLSNGPPHAIVPFTEVGLGALRETFRTDFVVGPRSSSDPTSVVLTPETVSIQEGSSTTLTATVRNVFGSTLPGAAVAWSSTSPGIASVSPSGQSATVQGVAAGTARVIAEANGYADTTVVTVSAIQPLAITQLSGPSATTQYMWDWFSVSTSGGRQPLTYQWYINGAPQANSNSSGFGHTNDGYSYSVMVTVTDADGVSRSSSMWVEVYNCGGQEICD